MKVLVKQIKKHRFAKAVVNGIIALALLPGFWAGAAEAQENTADKSLPVKSVTLFTSGVSFTLREGQVAGDARVPLTFRTAQINDILKSLVLLDDKGTVQPVVYAAKDPISRTLQSFVVDVTQPLSRTELLNRLRGREVTVTERLPNGERQFAGRIVGVETKMIPVEGRGAVPVEILSLLSEDGLEWVRLDNVDRLSFTEERVNREFREALSLLAAGADDRLRQVVVRFEGSSSRRVRVGYVSEAPLWKMTYRLLISEAGEKPYVQGWALVENTTGEDWENIKLSLVSGRPVSFIQDLYQPLYLPRPVVPLDIVASPYPQLAGAAIEAGEVENLAVAPPVAAEPMVAAKPSTRSLAGRGAGGAARSKRAEMPGEALADEMRVDTEAMANVEAQATGETTGELFQYNVTTPVTLPRQQAAMIPVISQNIGGEKLSLYNPRSLEKHPLNAFRIKNDTGLHLKGGPVTVFDGGIYAGDARMEDVPPGDSRLITYAVDLAVEAERQIEGGVSQEIALTIKQGILTIARKEQRQTRYTLKNKAETARTVLVEHPFEPEYTLVTPKEATERTREYYRFRVAVPANRTGALTVVQERLISEGVALLAGDIERLEYYVTRKEVPQKLKTALQGVVTRRRKVLDLRQELAEAEAEIKSVDSDQDRIRKNMAALDRNSALYKRYVDQLNEQETRIQTLREKASRLRSQITEAEKELRSYIDSPDI